MNMEEQETIAMRKLSNIVLLLVVDDVYLVEAFWRACKCLGYDGYK